MKRLLPVLFLCMAVLGTHAQDIVLNPDFGNKGLVVKSPEKEGNGAWEYTQSVFELPDGKLLLAVRQQGDMYLIRYFPNGTIDKSFGREGYSDPLNISGFHVVRTAEGRILVAGVENTTERNFVLHRLTENGQLDTGFGNKGTQMIPKEKDDNQFTAMALQPDGKILLLGTFSTAFPQQKTFLRRLLPNGMPDFSFAGNGRRVIDIPGVSNAKALLTIGSKILVGATSSLGQENDMVLAQFTGDGTPDLGFADKGIAIFDLSTGDQLQALTAQNDGKILLAGSTAKYQWGSENFTVLRILPNGKLDESFKQAGMAVINFGAAGNTPATIITDALGRITVAGQTSGAGSAFAAARLNSKGELDPGFGEQGRKVLPVGLDNVVISDGLLTKNGAFIGAGYYAQTSTGQASIDYLLVQLNPLGQPVTDFGKNGLLTGYIPFATSTLFNKKFQSDGKIIVRYAAQGEAEINGFYRFLPDGKTDQSFGENGFLATKAYYLDLLPDNRLVSFENIRGSNNSNTLIMRRYSRDGKPDASFGEGGEKRLAFQKDNILASSTVLPDGRLLLAALYYGSNGWQQSFLVRLDADGNTDLSFGKEGSLSFTYGLSTIAERIIPQPDGKILVSGNYFVTNTNLQFFLTRFTKEGRLDEGFGEKGSIVSNEGISSRIVAVAMQPDEKILLGTITSTTPGTNRFFLQRITADGKPDQGFGDKGSISITNSAPLVLPNGKILLNTSRATPEGSEPAMMLLNPNGSLDERFGEKGVKTFGFGSNTSFAELIEVDGKLYGSGSRKVGRNREALLVGFLIEDPVTVEKSITGLFLVNASTNKDIQELKDGNVIDLSSFPNQTLNIRANTIATVGSVIFALHGPQSHTQTESILPYALFGDDMKGRYYGSLLPAGRYTLTATPFKGSKGSGEQGAPVIIRFTIVYSAAVPGFTLVNADTNKDLMPLKEGDVLNLATLPSMRLNIRANTTPGNVGSVVFDLTGAQVRRHTENSSPYALFVNNRSDYYAWTPPLGNYTLTATPHSAANGGGEKGGAKTIRFRVSYQPVQSFTLVNAENGKDIQELKGGDVVNLSRYPGIQVNIRANTGAARVGSLDFSLQGPITHHQTENLLPYALFGDDMKGRFYGRPPVAGSYTLIVTPYSAANKGGLKGKADTIRFRVVTATNACESPAFTPAVFTWSNVGGYQTSTADFNNDGRPDLAVLEYNSFYAGVLLGKGDGSFTEATPCNTGGRYPQALATGDFNGDGKADLIITNEYDDEYTNTGIVSVLLGKGDGSFAAPIRYVTGVTSTIAKAADFNGDGKLDLALANNLPGTVVILPGKGDGSFGASTSYSSGGYFPWSMIVSDFNRDGHNDLAIGFDNAISVMYGKEEGFAAAVTYPSGGSVHIRLAVADLNGDAKPDLVFTNYYNGELGMLFGQNDGTFSKVVRYPTTIRDGVISIAVDDFNGDDLPDLAIGNVHTRMVSLLPGNGDGSFAKPVDFAAGFRHALTIEDFNGDGKKDVSFSSFPYGVGVMLNTCGHTALPAMTKKTNEAPVIVNASEAASLNAGPNPFSSKTTVRFSVPVTGQVVLAAYNTSGLEVANLYRGKAEGGRAYQVNFDGGRLPAGVYLLRLSTGKEMITTRVVLVR